MGRKNKNKGKKNNSEEQKVTPDLTSGAGSGSSGIERQAGPSEIVKKSGSSGIDQTGVPAGIDQKAGSSGHPQKASSSGIDKKVVSSEMADKKLPEHQLMMKPSLSQQLHPPRQEKSPANKQPQSMHQLQQSLKDLQIQDSPKLEVARRPLKPPGTKYQRKIKVLSNHLELNVDKLKSVIMHYDVKITPNTPKNMLADVMKIVQQKYYPSRFYAFDNQQNLYAAAKLPIARDFLVDNDIVVEREGRPRTFQVELKLVKEVDMSSLKNLRSLQPTQEALQVVDIVLRNAPSQFCITSGRSFFPPPRNGQIIQLGNGMQMNHGFYQSAILGWKPFLNVDVVHKAFPQEQPVLDLICDLGSDFRQKMSRESLSQPLEQYLFKGLEKFIKTLKVQYELPGFKRVYRVNGLDKPPKEAKFTLENGEQITVEQYFRKYKQTVLKYSHLPSLWVGSKDRKDKILLPLELCKIVPGQVVNRKMDEKQTSAMIKHAATTTTVRKDKIMSSIQSAGYNEDECVKDFGLSIGNEFVRLDARILAPPRLTYSDGKTVVPQKGVWRSDGNRFFKGAVINKWTVTAVTKYTQNVERFADDLFTTGKSCGINFTARAVPYVHIGGTASRPPSKQDILKYLQERKDYDLIFVIVPDKSRYSPCYDWVKQTAELNVGCLTQCLQEKTFRDLAPGLNNRNAQTLKNLLLKVNGKMNGVNHILTTVPLILSKPCMIMGADVTHPSPDERNRGVPSVAAVTASYDPYAFNYSARFRLQPATVEIIADLCNIVKEYLMFFYRKTSRKPERLVFYRDGVSEGQFDQVANQEITAIKRACKEIQKEDYEPAITFLVVQKRHHTRLFPVHPGDSEDRNNNVPAGTCVDTEITSLAVDNFYLVSHASPMGVARPTKYCTLLDENDMSNDDLEALTYHLCHLYTRCNRSVSYPAPTYFAHWAAARGKVYISGVENMDMDRLEEYQQRYCQVQDSILKGKPMFFA